MGVTIYGKSLRGNFGFVLLERAVVWKGRSDLRFTILVVGRYDGKRKERAGVQFRVRRRAAGCSWK